MERTTRWRVNAPDVIGQTIDGETIILHLGNGFYFSTQGSGPLVWDMLGASYSLGEVSAAVAQRYDVAAADVEPDVQGFVQQLCAEGLLVEAPGAAAPPTASASGSLDKTGAFVPPTLQKFTDMEDLLLLDPVHEVSPERGWPHVAPGVDV